MAGDFFTGKKQAREELERRRRSLSPEQVRSKGEEARARLLALPFFHGAIASYAAQPFELEPPPGALPRVVKGTRELVFHLVMGELERGVLGIRTPAPSWPVLSQIDVFVVPAVGLGLDGSRLGRGAGYYDTTLKQHPRAVKVGFTFDCCVVDALPMESWDVYVDWVVTESRALRVQPARSPNTHE
ncbi:MAG: 5-formyltetrahydrofolate cyclo-ligase [Archangiaceae bacterium]|nr:5-formyltetrahydrofolate cyclo-ligase [Archangiaceae bacterium]